MTSLVIPWGQTCEPWCTPDDLCFPCTEDLRLDPQIVLNGCQWATDILYNLTRRQWGGRCTETYRPPGSRCPIGAAGMFVGTGRYVTSDGVPVGALLHRGQPALDRENCGCGWLSQVQLPGPVVQDPDHPVTVFVDGVPVPASEYRVDNHDVLVGLRKGDGTLRVWPVCQRLDLADGEVGTWHIELTHGRRPPRAGVDSAASLACQWALAKSPPDVVAARTTRLSQRVAMATRQGESLTFNDLDKIFSDGKTGVNDVDQWLSSLRFGDAQRTAAIFDPAAMRSVRRTGR